MILSKDYQLISLSSQLPATGGGYYGAFFTEVYARAIPDETTGIYTVYLKLMLACTINSQFYQYPTSFSGSIGGVSVFSGTNKPWSAWSEKSSAETVATTISEGSATVDASDGLEKTVTLATVWKFLGAAADYTPYYGATAETSDSVTLAAIPRASKVSDLRSSDGTFDGEVSYLLTPSSGALNNRQTVSFNGERLFSSDLGRFSSPQRIVIHFDDYLDYIYSSITDATNANISVTLETYNDVAVIGTESTSAEVLIPSNESTRPEITSAEIFPQYIPGVDFGGAYVNGKTTVGYTAEATAKYGAAINGYEITGDYLYVGERTVELRAIDSRGIRSMPKSFAIKVYDYRVPIIVSHLGETEVLCYRCDEDGNQSDKGANCYLKFGQLFSDIPGNICRVNYRLRGEGEPWGGYTLLTAAGTEYAGVVRSVFPNPTKAYHIQLQIIDSGNEFTTKTFPIAADWVDYQYNGQLKSWSFGEACPAGREKAMSYGLKAYFDKGVSPIAFAEDAEIYIATDESLLLPLSRLREYTLFIIKLGGDLTSLHLGVKWEDTIYLVEESAIVRLNDTTLELEGVAGTYISHIYGIL